MAIVTSFIPGRVRLRHRIFRDDDISSALISLIESTGIVTSVERNAETGSLLVTYKAESIPSKDKLMDVFSKYIPQFNKLKFRVLYYEPKDKAVILDAIEEARAELPSVSEKLGL